MEKYHKSVQGVCILKCFDLPIDVIYRIRYYVNFAVDITGYTRMDLIRNLTVQHRYMNDMYNNMWRSHLIRLLYLNKIHIKPRKQTLGVNRFKDLCKCCVKGFSFNLDSIRLDNDISISYDTRLLLKNRLSYFDNLFDYKIGYLPAIKLEKNMKMIVYCVRHISINNPQLQIFTVRLDVWEYIFMMIHSNSDNHLKFFAKMNRHQQNRYFDLLHEYNITREKEFTKKFYQDCTNASLEFINMYLFRNKLILF